MGTPATYEVPSESNPSKTYTVTVYETYAECTCPAWRRSRLPPRERVCKHIEKITGELRKGDADLTDDETAWLIRALVKLTDRSFRSIVEAVREELDSNEHLTDYELDLGENIILRLGDMGDWEGDSPPGPDAQQALALVQRALKRESA